MASDAIAMPRRPPAPTWLVVTGVWTAFGLVSASQTYLLRTLEGEFVSPAMLLVGFAVWVAYAFVTPAVVALGRHFPFERGRWARSVPVHLLAAALVGAAHSLLIAWLSYTVYPQPAQPRPLSFWIQMYVVNRFQSELIVYFAILGAGYALEYYRRFRARELDALRLEAQLAQAQLQALQMQLHPHFLFNTLHAIGVLVREDPARAERTVALLGDLLRHTLAHAGTSEVPLRRELDFLALYLEIERTRFPDRLTVAFDVDPAALDTRVPHFVLQPLVENAVRYGIAPRSDAGRIEIRAARRNGSVALEVWNDGPPLPAMGASRAGGIGLATTRDRLERLYGARGAFAVENAPEGGVVARVTVPADA